MTTTIKRGFLQTTEGQLHYRRFGHGEPFVLMMTLPFNTSMFHPLMVALGDSYDCIAIDLMGQGDSDLRRRSWDCRDHAEAVLAGLDDLGVRSVRMLGGHFTAQVAIEAALLAPDRLEQLFLDGIVAWSLEEGREAAKSWPAESLSMSARTLSGQWEYFHALVRRLDPEFELRKDNMHVIAELGFAFMKIPLGGPDGQGMYDYDLLARAVGLKTPTVLIGSPTDTLRGHHEKALAAIPGAREFLFDTVNPLYQFDQPNRAAEYAAMLRRFLRLPTSPRPSSGCATVSATSSSSSTPASISVGRN